MRRIVMVLLALSLFVAACGGAADTTGTTGAGVDSTAAEPAVTSTSPAPTTGDTVDTPSATESTVQQSPATAAATDFDGPVAADFSIDLNATGTFTLSEETRPVYLVFWAEW